MGSPSGHKPCCASMRTHTAAVGDAGVALPRPADRGCGAPSCRLTLLRPRRGCCCCGASTSAGAPLPRAWGGPPSGAGPPPPALLPLHRRRTAPEHRTSSGKSRRPGELCACGPEAPVRYMRGSGTIPRQQGPVPTIQGSRTHNAGSPGARLVCVGMTKFVPAHSAGMAAGAASSSTATPRPLAHQQ